MERAGATNPCLLLELPECPGRDGSCVGEARPAGLNQGGDMTTDERAKEATNAWIWSLEKIIEIPEVPGKLSNIIAQAIDKAVAEKQEQILKIVDDWGFDGSKDAIMIAAAIRKEVKP